MRRLTLPSASWVYVDANAVIYRVERIEPYASASSPFWESLDEGLCNVYTSELSWLEVLVKPNREGNQDLIALFRASYRLKTPDAIHAATALHLGAVMFVTNDAGFRQVLRLNVVLLDEVVAS